MSGLWGHSLLCASLSKHFSLSIYFWSLGVSLHVDSKYLDCFTYDFSWLL